MSIRKSTTSRGQVRYRVYVNDRGRDKRIYLGSFDRLADAQEAEHEAKRRLKLGEPVRPKPAREELTFPVLAKRWIASRANIRRATRVDYEQSIRRLKPLFGRKLVSEINRADVDAAVSAIAGQYAPSTCRKAMVVFAMIMKSGIAWGHLDVLPTYGQRLALPKVRKRRFEPLTPEQVNSIIDAAPEYWKPAVLLLFTAGPRRAELFGLTLDDLDLQAGTIYIRHQMQRGRLVEPKSDAAIRKVVLPARTVEALKRHVESVPPSDLHLLFPTEAGRPVDANNWFHRVWVPTRERAGLPTLRVHDARHHLASVLLGQGRSVKFVQKMLGHATAAILLDVYAWVTKGEEDDAAAELDRWLGEEQRGLYRVCDGLSRNIGGTPRGRCQTLAA